MPVSAHDLSSMQAPSLRAAARRRTRPLRSPSARRSAADDATAVRQVRQELARDLHDHVGSGLGSLAVLADLLSEGALDATATRDVSRRIARTAVDLSEALGNIVWSLHGAEAELGDLADELGDLARALCPRAAVRVRIDARTRERTASPRLARAALLIGREAVHNAARHADARHIDLEFGASDAGFCLTVADDGRGFSPRPDDRLGLGLASMAQRAEDAGGSLAVHSRPGDGARVRARLPWTRQP